MNWVGGARARNRFLHQQNADTTFRGQGNSRVQFFRKATEANRNHEDANTQDDSGRANNPAPYTGYNIASDPTWELVSNPEQTGRRRTLPIVDYAKENLPQGDMLALHLTHVLELDIIHGSNQPPVASSSDSDAFGNNLTGVSTPSSYFGDSTPVNVNQEKYVSQDEYETEDEEMSSGSDVANSYNSCPVTRNPEDDSPPTLSSMKSLP